MIISKENANITVTPTHRMARKRYYCKYCEEANFKIIHCRFMGYDALLMNYE